MSAVDAKMIDEVVRRVLVALRYGGATAGPAPMERPPASPALLDATTGRAKLNASPVPAPAKIFVTEEMLALRLAGRDAKAVTLAHNEHLTPAAKDLVDLRRLTVERAEAPLAAATPAPSQAAAEADSPPAYACQTPAPAARSVAPPARTVAMVTERPDAKVASLLAALGRDGLSLIDYNQTDCWIRNVSTLAAAVTSGAAAVGVAVLPHAADAVMLANKIDGIRAVQGTRADSVAAAVRHYDANVLVLEHAVSTFHEMRWMIRRFAMERSAQPAAEVLMWTIASLEGGR